MARSSVGFKKDTVVEVTPLDGATFIGVVMRSEPLGFWIQDFDDDFRLRCRWITRQHNEIREISGYRGVSGLAIRTSERFSHGYIWVWEHLPPKFALERMVNHALEACDEWKRLKERCTYRREGPDGVWHPHFESGVAMKGQQHLFQIQNSKDPKDRRIPANAIAEGYDRLVKDRPNDFDPKNSKDNDLEYYFDLSPEEALACFQKRPTAAMADMFYDRWADESFGTGLDDENLLPMFERICSVIRPDMHDGTQELYGQTLGRMLYDLATEELESMRDKSMREIATRFTKAIKALPRRVIITMGKEYTEIGPEANDMPAFEELHLLE